MMKVGEAGRFLQWSLVVLFGTLTLMTMGLTDLVPSSMTGIALFYAGVEWIIRLPNQMTMALRCEFRLQSCHCPCRK